MFNDGYYVQLYLAWAVRGIGVLSILAIIASAGGCTHSLDLNSSGSLHRDPPQIPTAN